MSNSFSRPVLPLIQPGVPVVPADYFVLQLLDGNARISFFPLCQAITSQVQEQMAVPPGIRVEQKDPLELPPGAVVLFNPNGLMALINLVSDQLLRSLEDPGLSPAVRMAVKEGLDSPNNRNLPEVLRNLAIALESLQN